MNKLRGFTLLEAIVVIVLIGIIFVVGSRILSSGFNAYLTGRNTLDAVWQSRIALEKMTRDIRAVRSPNDISTATPTQFSFVDTDGNTIIYSLSGTSLLRNGQILADGISALFFLYLNQNASVTGTLSQIRYVYISLTVTQNEANYSLTTAIYPRNLI